MKEGIRLALPLLTLQEILIHWVHYELLEVSAKLEQFSINLKAELAKLGDLNTAFNMNDNEG